MDLPTTPRSCLQFSDWTGGRTVPTVGTNTGAAPLPFQSWRRFKEAFAPELVERALSEVSRSVNHVVDPFGGSGTTALASQFLGVSCTTIEVNPYLADLIEAKLALIDFQHTSELLAGVMDRVSTYDEPVQPVFPGAPSTFVEPGTKGRYIFPRAVARRILAYRTAIDGVPDPTHRRLFRVILASTVLPVSNVVVSGKGRRYRRNWKEREHSPQVVDELFRSGVLKAIYDLRRYAQRRTLDYRILRGDARALVAKTGPYDLAVFSPPYPNSFDYTDVYNLELWTMGYLDSRVANMRLRHSTLSSHVQLVRRFEYGPVESPTLQRTVDELHGVQDRLWSKHIPAMIRGYATDMAVVLTKLGVGLRDGGRVYLVVGDSSYGGVVVPVSTIISEVAQSVGYRLLRLEECRSIRSSPQQGGESELDETLIVLGAR